MTDREHLVTEDDWGLSPAAERDLIVQRLCSDDELGAIGEMLGLVWFDEHTVGYRNREEAREQVVETVEEPAELETVLSTIEGEGDWFYGWHYVVNTAERGGVTVSHGPAREQWQSVVEAVEQYVADNERLAAFVRGIIAGDTASDTLRVSFSEAKARGNQYYDEGRLSANTIATEPGLLPGITTRKGSSSGRSYRVARELVPVIEAALDKQAVRETVALPTPDPDVPDEIDRRVPKFDEVLDEVTVTEADIERFESILAEHEALDYWRDYVTPTVKFRPRAKEAILCLLASPADAHGTKGRTNAIIYGPPGTGKSAFKEFLVDAFGAYSIDGARVSKADLTYNKAINEDGLLVRAHKGLAVIDEADEMDADALGAALTALGETGQVEIRDMRLPAEVRGVMLGNYRSRDEIVAEHSAALLNRFEFVLEFDRLTADERDAALDWQYEHFRAPKQPGDTEELKKFIAWVREFDPAIPEDELTRIKHYKHEHIEAVENVREGIAVMTVAYTIARLNRRDVTLPDYERALTLINEV